MKNLPYDDSSIKDIFRYSNELVGKNFESILSNVFSDEELIQKQEYYNNPNAKGSLGNLLEEHYC